MKTAKGNIPISLIRLLVLAGALLLAARPLAAEATKPVKVFIFAGQSNMEGADAHPERIDDFPMFKGAGAPQPDVLYACLAGQGQDVFKGWGPLQPLRSFGSELTFARLLKEHLEAIGQKPAVKERVFQKGLPFARKSRVRLFVLAGQRNMEGEDAFVSEISPASGFGALVQAQEDVLFRYSLGGGVKVSRAWESLGPVDYLGTFGPELSFGARLRKSLDGKDGLALVKFTHSGAQGPDWFPRGSPETHRNLYPKFIAFIREAIHDLARQGYDCTLEGVFWHPGENDTYFEPYQQKYAAWMKDLITQVRLDFKAPALAWFISEQHPRAIWRNMDAMNAALNTMAQSEQQVFLIKTAHLPHARLHFGTQGTLLLGEELAQAYLKLR
jgi:hypothetical protein